MRFFPGFPVGFPAPAVTDVGMNVGLNVGLKLTENQKKVLALLLKDGTQNAVSLSRKLGVSVRTVERALTKLQDTNFIIRSGSRRDGKWIVVKAK